jgi:hypothetical protein
MAASSGFHARDSLSGEKPSASRLQHSTNLVAQRGIDEPENVIGPFQQRHETRRLLQELSEAFAFARDLLPGVARGATGVDRSPSHALSSAQPFCRGRSKTRNRLVGKGDGINWILSGVTISGRGEPVWVLHRGRWHWKAARHKAFKLPFAADHPNSLRYFIVLLSFEPWIWTYVYIETPR